MDDLAQIAAGKMTAGDLAGAELELQRIIDMEEFEFATDVFRARIHMGMGLVKISEDNVTEAMEYLDLAAPMADRLGSIYWTVYIYAAARADQMGKALHAAVTISARVPELMSSWNEEQVFDLLRGTHGLEEAKADRITLIDLLWRTGFAPKSGSLSMEYYYQELLNAHIAEGDIDSAKLVAETLKGPDSVQQLSTNTAYADFAPEDVDAALAAGFDLQLRGLYQAAEDSPNLADPIINLTYLLNIAGRPAEALELLDAALKRVADAPLGIPAFDDQSDKLEWLHNTRARTLVNLGRWQEALEAQIEAQKVAKAADRDAVSQAVNLGEYYILMGKPELAAEVIADADPDRSSPYGRMSILMIRTCASERMGEIEEAKTLLNSMLENVDDAPGPLFWTMLCTNDIDALAELLSRQLQSLETRREALDFLQRFLVPADQPEFYAEMEARKESLRNHPTVQAALKDCGRILKWAAYD